MYRDIYISHHFTRAHECMDYILKMISEFTLSGNKNCSDYQFCNV